jgi:hypothetical protein
LPGLADDLNALRQHHRYPLSLPHSSPVCPSVNLLLLILFNADFSYLFNIVNNLIRAFTPEAHLGCTAK